MDKRVIKKWWNFLAAMTRKELTSRYKNAFFGFLWLFINPLIQMLVIGLVFQFFVPIKVDNYFLYLLLGLLLWNFFSLTILRNSSIIVTERSLVNKANFPRETIVLSVVLSNFINLLIGLLLVLIAALFFGSFNWWSWLVSAVILVPLLFLTTGFSLLFSALNVRFRDISFMVQALVPLWFYATPVVYSLDLIPENIRNYFYLNPMTGVIELYRFFVLGINPVSMFWALWSLVIPVLILLVGGAVFLKNSPYFDDWI